MDESAFFVLQTEKGKCHMTISKITKKNFSIFLKTEVQIIDGDIISDSGKNKGHYYFVKIPIHAIANDRKEYQENHQG